MREGERRDHVNEETQSHQKLRRDHVTDLQERLSVENEEKQTEKSKRTVEEHKETVRSGVENTLFALCILRSVHPYHGNTPITQKLILFILIAIQLDSRSTCSLHRETLVATGRPVRYICL